MDIIDRAQELEREMTKHAIAAARTRGVDILPGCVDCEKPIPEGRLRIRPDAVRCVGCKEKHESA